MKLPVTPPDPTAIVQEVINNDPTRLTIFIEKSSTVDAKGRYLHWDKFRFKTPPKGLSQEESWAITRMARAAASQPLPLKDTTGLRFSFCEPPALKVTLRELDMNAGGALASDATSAEHESRNAISYLTARKDLESLVASKCLQRRKIGRSILYVPVPNLMRALSS